MSSYRVAMVAACPFPWPRGTPIRIHRLARALALRGHEVHVVTYHLGEPLGVEPFRLHRIRHVPGYRRHAPGPTYAKLAILDPLLAILLRRLLRAAAFDLIHAHHYEGLLVARAARVDGVPIVYDAHTTLESELPDYSMGLGSRLGRWLGRELDRRLPRLADHVVSVSDPLRRRLIELDAVDGHRITVAPNGVEADVFADVAPPREAGNGGPSPSPRVAFAGNLAPHQGLPFLLRGFREVIRRMPQARLVVISDGSFGPYEELASECGIRDSIELVDGSFERLPTRLAEADVLVNPRVACVGLPQKVLNYMASGRPIVSFRGSAVHLRQDETALLVEDGDTDALGASILRLLEDRALGARLGEAARTEAATRFSWDLTATRVEGTYRRLTGDGRRSRSR